MERFCADADGVNRRGARVTSAGRVAALMGPYSRDEFAVQMCHRLLREHFVEIKMDGEDPKSETFSARRDQIRNQETDFVTSRNSPRPPQRPTQPPPPPRPTLKPSPSGRGSRSVTSRSLAHSPLATHFQQGNFCRLAALYQEAKTGRDGIQPATLLKTTQYLHRYVEFCRKSNLNERDEWRLVTSHVLAEQFLVELKNVFRPVTVKNHASAVLRFLRDAEGLATVAADMTEGLEDRYRRAIAHWTEIVKKTDRDARKHQNARITSGDFTPCKFGLIRRYTSDPTELGRVEQNLVELEESFRTARDATPSQIPNHLHQAWLGVTRFLVVSVLEQGQRLCVYQNLTQDEYREGRMACAKFVVRIKNHKTSAFFGPACLILEGNTLRLWNRYAALREQIRTEDDKFLLTPNLTPVPATILCDLNAYLNRHGAPVVNFSDVRKSIETLAQFFADAVTGSKDAVQLHLGHGSAVTAAHYQFKTDAVLVQQAKAVTSVVEQSLMPDYIWNEKDTLLPESGFDRFPSRDDLFRSVLAFSETPVRVSHICRYAYDEIRRRWLEEHFDQVRTTLASRIASANPTSVLARSMTLRNHLQRLDEVWSNHLTDLESAVLNE